MCVSGAIGCCIPTSGGTRRGFLLEDFFVFLCSILAKQIRKWYPRTPLFLLSFFPKCHGSTLTFPQFCLIAYYPYHLSDMYAKLISQQSNDIDSIVALYIARIY